MLQADSDGDGVLDGADDQDHDDIPNVMEMSRNAASGLDDNEPGRLCTPQEDPPLPDDFWHPERVRPGQPVQPLPAEHPVAHLPEDRELGSGRAVGRLAGLVLAELATRSG